MAELALSGATTIADHHYIFSDAYDFDPADLLFDTAQKFGVRFVFCRGGATQGRTFDEGRIKPIPTEPLEQMLASVEKSAARWHDPSPDSMRRVVLAPTTPTFSLDEGELREMAKTARAKGLRMHTHLSETSDYDAWTESKYGMRPIHWIGKNDWLGPDVWFAISPRWTTARFARSTRREQAWRTARRPMRGLDQASRRRTSCRAWAATYRLPSMAPRRTKQPTWRPLSTPHSPCIAPPRGRRHRGG